MRDVGALRESVRTRRQSRNREARGMTRFLTAKTLALALGPSCTAVAGITAEPAATRDYPIQPVPFAQTDIADAFWAPRIEKNREVTVQHNLQSCERTGRIQNFVVAA